MAYNPNTSTAIPDSEVYYLLESDFAEYAFFIRAVRVSYFQALFVTSENLGLGPDDWMYIATDRVGNPVSVANNHIALISMLKTRFFEYGFGEWHWMH